MASTALQQVRDDLLYSYGYTRGRYSAFPSSLSELYGWCASKLSSLVALPLPLVSFIALPLFGGTSTSVNLVFFYLIWSSFVLSHDPLSVEIWGTLAVRMFCFLLPAVGFLAFDLFVPSLSASVKARAGKVPYDLGRRRLTTIVAVATFNILLSVALQAALELLATRVLHLRSILRVTTFVPLPWTLVTDTLKGLALRSLLHYPIHRYLLHTYPSLLRNWHLSWQHSLPLPFSILAAYDHPIPYLLSNWLPIFLPAYIFRFHVVTWHILLAVVSLEDLFLYSGYAVLPSNIILTGMARRTDAHFLTANTREKSGNFGHWGILDFALGTTCSGASDAFDDMQDEAEKHHLQERISDAAQGAKDGFQRDDESDEQASDPPYEEEETENTNDDGEPTNDTKQKEPTDAANDDTPTEQSNAPGEGPKRRSSRRKGKNGQKAD